MENLLGIVQSLYLASGHLFRRFWQFDLGSCQEWRVHLQSYIKIFLNQLPKCLHCVGSSHMEPLENDFIWRRFVLTKMSHLLVASTCSKGLFKPIHHKSFIVYNSCCPVVKIIPTTRKHVRPAGIKGTTFEHWSICLFRTEVMGPIRIWCAAEPVPLVSRQTSGIQ